MKDELIMTGKQEIEDRKKAGETQKLYDYAKKNSPALKPFPDKAKDKSSVSKSESSDGDKERTGKRVDFFRSKLRDLSSKMLTQVSSGAKKIFSALDRFAEDITGTVIPANENNADKSNLIYLPPPEIKDNDTLFSPNPVTIKKDAYYSTGKDEEGKEVINDGAFSQNFHYTLEYRRLQ